MRLILTLVLLVIPLWVAIYAQYRLPFHTPTSTQLWLTRLLLLAVGLAFGWAMSSVYLDTAGLESVVAFVSAFGVVHLPAAIILFLKKMRGNNAG